MISPDDTFDFRFPLTDGSGGFDESCRLIYRVGNALKWRDYAIQLAQAMREESYEAIHNALVNLVTRDLVSWEGFGRKYGTCGIDEILTAYQLRALAEHLPIAVQISEHDRKKSPSPSPLPTDSSVASAQAPPPAAATSQDARPCTLPASSATPAAVSAAATPEGGL